ncbi:uncharacterized protein K02A2.6-like [Saccostrea cucullata]|uniref:uncharacterized protein K02A2.6-like n=1 Tax=Saccostrea cuccullata TaxID=36930 RepID=UPI002ED3168E
MEIDTGASVSIISEETYKAIGKPDLQESKAKLKTYTGDEIPILGTCRVKVEYKSKSVNIPITVVRNRGPSLMGRDWLGEFQLDWSEIFSISEFNKSEGLKKTLDKFEDVFRDELGAVKGMKAKIYVDQAAQPRYYKARPVPYAIKEKVEQELDRLHKSGIIEPVKFSEWAAPIVPVVKGDGSIRICGDYKVTVNAVSKLDNYPIPKTEDLYATLGGGEEFTKLDMNQAYNQLLLEDESKKYVTVNTHKGLYQYNRLPYGVSSSPGIFQRTLENLLQGIPNVLIRVDDILVTGRTAKEHLENLEEVLKRIQDAGVRLKRRKCVFMAPEVVYLGYKINKQGIYPVAEKVTAIKNAPNPTKVIELKAYLGMLNYYNRFLPDLATTLNPLHKLLQKNQKWMWGKEQEDAFQKSKDLLQSDKVLVHYDPCKKLLLACDASPYGIGAVLSHQMEDGSERPISYASRTLTAAERNYSQLEKESLSIIFGIKKFHQYLFGRPVTIVTDHKPLIGLFSEDKQIPSMAASRIQRWALTLAAYEYRIVYKEGRNHGNADGLSRLPLKTKETDTPMPLDTSMILNHIDELPVTCKDIRLWTRRDHVLSKVLHFILNGWPDKCPEEECKPYFERRTELSSNDGCILWGNRVVVPSPGRKCMIDELHEGHPGITRMKSLARSYVWWPNMDSELERCVRECEDCQVNMKNPALAPLHPWEYPSKPWSRLHIDFAGPFMDNMYFVIMDAYSKWLEVIVMKNITTRTTIDKLRSVFATHGLPEVIVSDNGPSFTSKEFEKFIAKNGIRHIKTSPYHPSSNGCAERAVQTFKTAIKKITGGTIQERVHKFLFNYRITPQSTTGLTPSEMLMNRKLRSRLNLGSVVEITGPLSYRIKLNNDCIVRRHIDHILKRETKDISETELEIFLPKIKAQPEVTPEIGPNDTLQAKEREPNVTQNAEIQERRYPIRSRNKPAYLKDFQC